ncbi:hypothetical protein Goshw_013183 [Gossypium schwendimanii]|uniref:Uncharacterized protein n=1 Tax=Gossypium schwendimanii TaxID=34291 RepID=A0A7J9ND04_GOSSC|nr:hypothetical protein [Gossypium schwendimanii]
MPAEERVKVDSSDVCSYYSHGSTVISCKLIRICKKRTLSGELHGCFRVRFCIGVVILIGSLCLKFGELLVMPRC